jgi:NADPH2:quinone reductase
MKVIRVHEFGGPEKLVLEEVPDPKPSVGEVLVDVHATGVNPFETLMLAGTYAIKPQLPWTPGVDGAGTVAAVGDGVTTVKKGDRVYIAGSVSGTYAEKSVSKATKVRRLPEHVSFEQGAAIGVPYATAYRGVVHLAKGQKGETILIHGASGGTGLAAVQIAKSIGMSVIGTASTDKGRELVLASGAAHALGHSAKDELLKITNNKGANVIIEMLANKNLANDLAMIAFQGRIVIIGSRGTIEINPRDFMIKEANVTGFTLWNVPETDLASIHDAIVKGLESGAFKPVIDEVIPLAEAQRAYEAILAPGTFGKIVMKP